MHALFLILTVAEIAICGLLIIVILLQQGEGGGLAGAFGGGGGDTAFGVKAPGALKKTTVVLAGLFLVICIALGVVHQRMPRSGIAGSLDESGEVTPPTEGTGPETPTATPAGENQ